MPREFKIAYVVTIRIDLDAWEAMHPGDDPRIFYGRKTRETIADAVIDLDGFDGYAPIVGVAQIPA